MKHLALSGFAAFAMISVAGCGIEMPQAQPTADQRQRDRTEQAQLQAERTVPPPAISNFTELRFATMIQEKRDAGLITYAYSRSEMTGELQFLCESIGYGLPYSVQTTNPQKERWRENGMEGIGGMTMPQPEPNALYMPEGVAATWIMCANEDAPDGLDLVYWEPDLIVSDFKLAGACNLRAGDGNACS